MSSTEAKRWGSGTRLDSQFAQDQILDAAQQCYLSIGVPKTTVEDIAKEACVSRTTVYRYFKNRDEILTALVMRSSMILMDGIKLQCQNIDELGPFLVESMTYILVSAPALPTHELFFGPEGAAITSRLCVSSNDVFAVGVSLIEPWYYKAQGAGTLPADVSAVDVIEWVARILLSYWSNPPVFLEDEAKVRRHMQIFVEPVFSRKV